LDSLLGWKCHPMPPASPKRPRIIPRFIPEEVRKTQHRGVQLLPPDAGKRYWRARWRDPENAEDSGANAQLGGRRGEMEDGGKLSEWTINKYRRNTGIVLNALRKLQVVRLSRDEIADSLARTKVKLKRREFLKPEQIRKLIECCEKHDAETFELCRDGSTDTPRYEPRLARE